MGGNLCVREEYGYVYSSWAISRGFVSGFATLATIHNTLGVLLELSAETTIYIGGKMLPISEFS